MSVWDMWSGSYELLCRFQLVIVLPQHPLKHEIEDLVLVV